MAKLLSGLLVRRFEEGFVDGTAESRELDFDIPRGLAIEIMGIEANIGLSDLDGALIEMDAFVDLDGPALASNAISSEALFDARKVLDTNIMNMAIQVDNVTTGAARLSSREVMFYPDDARIITARNVGVAGFAKGASGELQIGIWFRWIAITDQEFIGLIIDLRS